MQGLAVQARDGVSWAELEPLVEKVMTGIEARRAAFSQDSASPTSRDAARRRVVARQRQAAGCRRPGRSPRPNYGLAAAWERDGIWQPGSWPLDICPALRFALIADAPLASARGGFDATEGLLSIIKARERSDRSPPTFAVRGRVGSGGRCSPRKFWSENW